MLISKSKGRIAIGAIVICAVTICAYFRGLFGEFIFDDFHNIVENPAIQVADGSAESLAAASLSSNAGTLRRPISMLSFAANHAAFGMNPIAFKAVNLILHLLIGGLIYALTQSILPKLIDQPARSPTSTFTARWISLAIAGFWLLHPLNVSNVLYVVQRMNQLSTLFILAGLLIYVLGRQRAQLGRPGFLSSLVLVTIFAALAVFSKENGLLIFPYLLVIEFVCFRFRFPQLSDRLVARSFFILTVAAPIVAAATFLWIYPEWLTSRYDRRDFSLLERLITQPRILFHYISWIYFPHPSALGLYHDDISRSISLLTPWTTLPALLGWSLALCIAIIKRNRYPLFSFGVLWFLAGHAMESTFIPLELVFEHRNYAPMIGVMIATIGYVSLLWKDRSSSTLSGCIIAALCLLAIISWQRASLWSDPIALAVKSAERHPMSARSHYDAGRMLYIEAMANNREEDGIRLSEPHFRKAMQLDEVYIHPVTSLILTQHRTRPTPEELIDELVLRISASRALQPNPILLLQEAISNRRIVANKDQMRRLFEATMDNPSLRQSPRAQLLNNYGRYHFVVLDQPQAAVSLTLAAAETDPSNPLFRINLTKLALALDDRVAARRYLEQAQRLDVSGIYRAPLAALSRTLSEFDNYGVHLQSD